MISFVRGSSNKQGKCPCLPTLQHSFKTEGHNDKEWMRGRMKMALNVYKILNLCYLVLYQLLL